MKDKRLIGIFLVIAIISGIAVGYLANAPYADAEDNTIDDNTILLYDCSIKATGAFRSVDVFNRYEDISVGGSYFGEVLKHCVYVGETAVEKSFVAERGGRDTGFEFIFQFVSRLGFTSSETFFASSGHSYYLTYWIRNGASSEQVKIVLHMV